jgi:hypothetical protein
MAHTTTHVPSTVTFSIFAPIGRFFAMIGKSLVMIGESSSRYRQVESLQALSDADLATRGIRRQDIVRVVYADAFWM